MENNHTPAAQPPKRKRRRGSRKHPAILALQIVLLLLGMGALLAGGAVTGYVAALVKDEPVRSYDEIHQKIFSNALTGFAYYNDGSLIGQLRAEEDRRLVKKSEVSPYLINALIATEDKYFYEHHGVVFQSTLRGALQELTHQPIVTGGSTLTQQLVKLTILSREVSHERKAREIFNALRIERMFSKDQILEAYLNEVYFGKSANGSNIYGVQAAAKGIFDKDVKDLTLAEASYIAGMVQSPLTYSPFTAEGYERGKERQKTVLDRMLENQYISRQEYDQALNTDLKARLAKPARRAYSEHPYLMMEIEERAAKALLDQQLAQEGRDKSMISSNEYRQLIEDKRREILRNGYHIYTTIDKDVNRIMEQIASDPKNFGPNASYTVQRTNGKTEQIKDAPEQVGSMLIQNKTGAILGMIGGRDFNVEQVNHATVPRQPGSSMKPLAAYAPAFELGYLQPATPIDDSPLMLADGQTGSHLPLNWDRQYHGMVSAREALRMSWNVPAIKTYLRVGIKTALEYVKKMGVTTLVESDDHAATGVIGGLAYGLTAEEITNAYATFANRGAFIDAYMIDRIEDSQGKVVYRHTVQPVPVFSEQTAYLITDMMRTVVNEGTGTAVRRYIPRNVDIAGKTGTTNNSNDLWFVGYTPEVSMGVWIGYDEPHPLPDSEKSRPQQIWGKVMKELMALKPSLSPSSARFEKPDGIVTLTVDSKSGLLPSELSKQTGHLITDLFNRQFVPTKTDDSHQKARVVTYNGVRYLAKQGTPDDLVDEGVFFRSKDPSQVTAEQILDKNKKAATRPLDWEQRLPAKEDPRSEKSGPPAPPGTLKLTQSGKQVTLTWTAGGEPDLAGYRVYRAGVNSGFVKLATVKDPSVTSYTDTASGAGEAAYYVTAVDITGLESPPSAVASSGSGVWQQPTPSDGAPAQEPGASPQSGGEDDTGPSTQSPQTGTPSAPKKVSIAKTAGGYKLSWAANPGEEQVIAYNIYYSRDGSSAFELLDTVAQPIYEHKTAESKGVYAVTAVNSYGESPRSSKVSAEHAR